jgi:hypothetical protein
MKWAIMLCSLVVIWILNAWYFMVFIGIVHSWWLLVPVMGFHVALILSGLVVAAIFVGRFISSFTVGAIKDLK